MGVGVTVSPARAFPLSLEAGSAGATGEVGVGSVATDASTNLGVMLPLEFFSIDIFSIFVFTTLGLTLPPTDSPSVSWPTNSTSPVERYISDTAWPLCFLEKSLSNSVIVPPSVGSVSPPCFIKSSTASLGAFPDVVSSSCSAVFPKTALSRKELLPLDPAA